MDTSQPVKEPPPAPVPLYSVVRLDIQKLQQPKTKPCSRPFYHTGKMKTHTCSCTCISTPVVLYPGRGGRSSSKTVLLLSGTGKPGKRSRIYLIYIFLIYNQFHPSQFWIPPVGRLQPIHPSIPECAETDRCTMGGCCFYEAPLRPRPWPHIVLTQISRHGGDGVGPTPAASSCTAVHGIITSTTGGHGRPRCCRRQGRVPGQDHQVSVPNDIDTHPSATDQASARKCRCDHKP